jgi:hypothetical protein
MYKVNNKTLPLDRAFTLGDIQYPSNWLRRSTSDARAALGITWETEPARADDRFYWNGDINNPKALEDREEVDEAGNPMYVQEWDAEAEVMTDTDERLVTKGLKSNWIAQVKATAGGLLAGTDWMVIRKAERDVPIDADVVAKRAAILAEANRLETAIAACADVAALIEVVSAQNWE